MKKKDENLNKVSIFYDNLAFTISLIVLGVDITALILTHVWDLENTTQRLKTHVSIDFLNVLFPIILFFLLFSLRRRRVDKAGVSATFLGIRYKHINWDDMKTVNIELLCPKYYKENPELYRDTFVFTSKPKNGKTAVIMMEATKEARMLAEKYFGPPAYVQEGVSVEEEK